MNKVKQSVKLIIWFGLSLAILLVIVSLVLPIGIIVSDYLGNTPFPLSFVTTSAILAVAFLAIFVKSLRRIEANGQILEKPKVKPVIKHQPEIAASNFRVVPLSNYQQPKLQNNSFVKTNISEFERYRGGKL